MSTSVHTFRFTHAVADQLAREAERQRTTSADIVRTALAQYFDKRQTESALLSLEQRIVARLDAHTQHLSAGLAKILAMAEPVQG